MSMVREKRTLSGPLLEVDFYPVFSDGRRLPSRAPKHRPTKEEQAAYNRKAAVKKMIRLVNANFDSTDFFFHPTYISWLAPQDEAQARRDIVNYFRRVKRARAKELKRIRAALAEAEAALAAAGGSAFMERQIADLQKRAEKLEQPFRYVYVIEKQTYKTGKNAGRVNWHFHAFMTGGMDAEILEEMWHYGVRVNVNRFKPEQFGPEAAARYMMKSPEGLKRFAGSRNLAQPVERIRTGRISRRGVERMAKEHADDAAFWERKYPGYRFLRSFTLWNEYNAHYYVSAVLYRAAAAPPWQIDDWITEEVVI